jgi:PAS domain S-box-containing protein
MSLQSATAALVSAVTPPQVAEVILDRGLALLRAEAGAVSLLGAEGRLERIDVRGFDAELLQAHDRATADAASPAADAARSGNAIWLESPHAIAERYPHLAEFAHRSGIGALAALALLVPGRRVGAITLAFGRARRFGAADRWVAIALADACALALERAALYEAERVARERAEETARLVEDFAPFRILVDQVHEYAIFMLDPQGIVRTWNRGAERIKGYRAEEIVGSHFSRFYTEADVRAGKPERELARAAAEGMVEDEGLRVRKDGSTFTADVIVTALRDPSGELRGFAKVTRDVTERQRAERERTRLAQAEEATRARDQFLGIASHELRTPITALGLQAQSLLRIAERAPERPLAEVVPRVRTLHRQTARLAHLVQALLDVTQVSAGKLALRREPLDLVDVVRDAMGRWREALARAGCPLELRVDRSVPGEWDRLRVEQVIDNLLENAVKFGAGKPVEIVVDASNGSAHLAVADHGIGISPDDQRRIFERFERAVPETHYGGFGLGLWIVRNIVEAHGGDIRVSSEPGKGSRFHVTLPAQRSA